MWLYVVVAVIFGALALALSVIFSGAVKPTEIADPGDFVRWAVPFMKYSQQLLISLVIGTLFTGAFLVAAGTKEFHRISQVAAISTALWTVVAAFNIIVDYSNTSGQAIGGPNFGQEIAMYVVDVPRGRIFLLIAICAMLTSLTSLLWPSPAGMLGTLAITLIPLGSQAAMGHAAGLLHHHLAMGAMFVHLVGAAVWIGVMLLLLLVGRWSEPAEVLSRFSSVAAWCLVMVGASGVVGGLIRLQQPSDLLAGYGGLLVAKTVIFGVLGFLGLAHRQFIIKRVRIVQQVATSGTGKGRRKIEVRRAEGSVKKLMWRLVGVEIVVMGAVSGVAAGLGISPPPIPQAPPPDITPVQLLTSYPAPEAPTLLDWFVNWRLEMVTATAAVAALVVYLRWVYRLHKRGDHWPVGRTVSAMLGIITFAWVTNSGPMIYGLVSFSAHMFEHMILAMVIPIFVVLSAPVTLALRALPARGDGSRGPREWILSLVNSKYAGVFANPVVAAVNFAGSMIVFYFTPLFELAVRYHVGHMLMIVHFIVVGYLFINGLIGIDPGVQRPGYPLRLLLMFATMAFHAFFGLTITMTEVLLAPDWYGVMGLDWGISAIDDQRKGGAVAWGIGEFPSLMIAITLAVMWSRSEDQAAKRYDRQAKRDDNAELKAYNEMLKELDK